MQCFKCGADIGDRLGTCDACRTPTPVRHTGSISPNSAVSLPWYLKLPVVLAGGITLLAITAITVYRFADNARPTYSSRDGQVEVGTKGGSDYLTFRQGTAVHHHGVIFDTHPQGGGPNGLGITMMLGYFKPQDHQTYEQHVRRSG